LFAYLFGSRTNDTATLTSDIDIAVYIRDEGEISLMDIKMSLHADLCRALQRNDVDLVVLNSISNTLMLENIVRQGSVIYDTDREAREDFEVLALHRAIDFRTHRKAIMGI